MKNNVIRDGLFKIWNSLKTRINPLSLPVMPPVKSFFGLKNVCKTNGFLIYQDMINPQEQIKSLQTITEKGKKIHWMIYFQSIFKLKEATISTEVR